VRRVTSRRVTTRRIMFAASAVAGRRAASACARRGMHTTRPAMGGADEPVRRRRKARAGRDRARTRDGGDRARKRAGRRARENA
jgi:hypothetical protein